MAHFEGAKREGDRSDAKSRLSNIAGSLKNLKRGTLISATVLVLAAEFRQSTSMLLDRELRRTKRGAGLIGSSLVSGFMIGSSLTSVGSQVVAAYAAKPLDLTYGDLIFASGIAVQTAIHFVKRRLKQNA